MTQSGYLSRTCPICGSKPPAKPEISSGVPAETKSFESLVPYWNGFFKDKVFFSYYRCKTCGLLYTPVFFSGRQLEQLYAQMPPNMDIVPITSLERTQRGYFDTMKSAVSLEGGFIEVGPDVGLFTKNCVKDGRFDQYWLFEPNRDVERTLSSTMGDAKFHIIHDMFGFSQVPDGAASVAVMVHVMDHLLDPVSTLRELKGKLAPRGNVMLVTHDEASLLRRVIGWKWPAFCLQHPEIYNLKTMRKLFEAAGYEVVKQAKTVNYFPVSFLLKQLLWALGLRIDAVPSFGQIAIGLKLGNMLTIATPKRAN
jgi:Methyltransferase domain